MKQDNRASLRDRAAQSNPQAVSSKASIPSAGLAATLFEMGEFLSKVRADIPEPTCSSIDVVLRDIDGPRKEADRLVRNSPECSDFAAFAEEVDVALYSLPDSLEQLRHDNSQLRDGVHHLGSYLHEAGLLLVEAAQRIEAGTDETLQVAQPEGQEPDPKDAPITNQALQDKPNG